MKEAGIDAAQFSEKQHLIDQAQELEKQAMATMQAVPAGFVYDPQSGYYHNAESGLYFDPQSTFYYKDGKWLYMANGSLVEYAAEQVAAA